MGPVARSVNWVNDYVIDSVVNGVAFLTKGLGRSCMEWSTSAGWTA